MNSLLKYIVVGIIIGGILPAILHPLKITVFSSVEDIVAHAISVVAGILISLIIYKIKKLNN